MNIFDLAIYQSATGREFLDAIKKVEYISTAPTDSDHIYEFRQSTIEMAQLISSLIKAKGKKCIWDAGVSAFSKEKNACWTLENAVVEYLAEQHNTAYCFPSDNFAKLSEVVKLQFAGSDAICHNINIIGSIGLAEGNQLLQKVEYDDDFMYIKDEEENLSLFNLFKTWTEKELQTPSDK